MKFAYIFCFFVAVGISAVSSFSWQTCGNPGDPMKVDSLSAFLNKSNFLYLTGKGKVAMNITAPIQAKLDVRKKFFWGWTSIPCVEQFGSCTYDDLCELNPYKDENCPNEFVNNNLPCKCPIPQGKYIAKKFPVDLNILPEWIEKGTYKIKILLFKDNKELMCIIVNLTL